MNPSNYSDNNTGINSPLLRQIIQREASWHVQESGGDIASAIERELLEIQLNLVEKQMGRLYYQAQYLRGRLVRLDAPESTSEGSNQTF